MSEHTAAECSGGAEAHDAHMELNDECPWNAKPKAEPFRLRNGSRVIVGDWHGIVVDQRGASVTITMPGGKLGTIERSQIVKGVVK